MSVWVWSGHLTAGAGAVGAYTLAADPGSYSITGTAASLVVGRVVVADAGTVAITGTDASLARGYVLVADAGSVAITGVAADLLTGRVVGADAGAVAITGTDAALARGILLVADAGSYAITGTAADLQRGYGLVAESGSVTITGVAATFLRDRILVGGTGLVEVLGGGGAGLLYGRVVAADAGAVAITGTAADLLRGYSVAADAGSYSITGVAADLLRGYVVAADAGSIAITGTAADLLRGYVVAATAGTVTITGTAADLVYGTAVAYELAAEAGTVTVTGADAALLYAANPTTFATASLIIPRLIQPRRWHTNGRPPDVRYLREVIRAQNHVVAYRRKTFFRWGDLEAPHAASASELKLFRFRCHTGHGATHIAFLLGLGRTALDNYATATPYANVGVTPVGGSATNVRVYGGQTNGTVTDAPSTILWRQVQVPVAGATTHEVIISVVDNARVLSACAYEIASREVDPSVNWYVAEQPGVEAPVFDATRERILRGMSELWRRNGTHLYTWPGAGTGTNPTFSASWTNVVDDGTGGANSATPGVYLLGDSTYDMATHCRRSDGATIDIVLAAHGSVAAGSDGEVRIVDSSTGAAVATLGSLGTSSQWYSTTATISNADLGRKYDIEARSAASTLTLNGVSVYSYLA